MNEFKKRRFEILSEIDFLARKCKCTTQEERDTCSNCKKLVQLGNELDLLNHNQRTAKTKTKNTGGVVIPYRPNNRDVLIMTVNEYLEFKRQQLNDKSIAAIKKVSPPTITYWRKKHAQHLQ